MATVDTLNRELLIEEAYSKLLEDQQLRTLLHNYNLISEPSAYSTAEAGRIKEVAVALITNKASIFEYKIEELLNRKIAFSDIASAFEEVELPEDVYHQIFYLFKYCSVKTFFSKNYKYFMPEYDYFEIQSRDKTRIFVDSFLRELDKFSKIIDDLYTIVDIDQAPEEYIIYLAQLIGYEKDDNIFAGDAFFRELVKNIIEIYKIKGTNYSFELFLNFIGFDITLYEYWFDRRYYYSNETKNPFTGETDKSKYLYYMTPYKPSTVIPPSTTLKEVVTIDNFSPQRNLYMFNKKAQEVPIKDLLGFNPSYTGETYKYFKTNAVSYNIKKIKTDLSDAVEETSAQDLLAITKYINFLTPIFIIKNVMLLTDPYEDEYTSALQLGDGGIKNLRTDITGSWQWLPGSHIEQFWGWDNSVPTSAEPLDYYWGLSGASGDELIEGDQEFQFAVAPKHRTRTIRDIYHLSKAVFDTGTTTNPRASIHGRTIVSPTRYYGYSWDDKYDPASHRYMFDSIFVEYDKVN